MNDQTRLEDHCLPLERNKKSWALSGPTAISFRVPLCTGVILKGNQSFLKIRIDSYLYNQVVQLKPTDKLNLYWSSRLCGIKILFIIKSGDNDFNTEGMAWLHICFGKSLKWPRTPGPFLSAKGWAAMTRASAIPLYEANYLQWLWGLRVNHSRNTCLRMRSWRNLTSGVLGFTGRKLQSMNWKYLLPSLMGTYSAWKTAGAINQLQQALPAANPITIPSCALP